MVSCDAVKRNAGPIIKFVQQNTLQNGQTIKIGTNETATVLENTSNEIILQYNNVSTWGNMSFPTETVKYRGISGEATKSEVFLKTGENQWEQISCPDVNLYTLVRDAK